MHVRRLTVAALSLLLPLTAAACGGDDDKADSDTTTTTASDSATTVAPADDPADTTPDAPTTTLSEADFNAAIDAFNTSLDEAGDDFCKITAATNTLTVSSAATPEQAKALYQAFADVLNKVADHLPVDSGADSATLKSAAEKILSDAEADGYDPATISGGSPEAFNDPEIAKSMAAVGEAITKNCQ